MAFAAEEWMRGLNVGWHCRMILAEGLAVQRFHQGGVDSLKRVGDGKGLMLCWNGGGIWWQGIAVWSGEDGTRFLSKRLYGFAVCSVDVWKIFGLLWNKTVAAVVLSVKWSIAG